MKRVVPFAVLTLGLAPPAAAQQVSAPLTPTPPAISLGAGLPTALANPANSSGGVPLMAGVAAAGHCLTWSATGIADAGASCLLAPIGAAILAGTGAASAASLADRATDFGATFNLKTDFGAKCDGATDDSAAIAAAMASGGRTIRVPSGQICYAASGVTVPAGVTLDLGGFNPGNPLASGGIECPASTSPCVTLGSYAANGTAALRNGAVTRAGTPSAGSVGVQIYGYHNTVTNVVSDNSAKCWAFSGDAAAGAGIHTELYGASAERCSDAYVDINTWPEVYWVGGRFGENGSGDYAASAYVRIEGGSAANPSSGPNTITFDNVQMNAGSNPPTHGFEFVNLGSGGAPAIDAAEFKMIGGHIEGVTGAVIYSDATWNQIDRLQMTNVVVNSPAAAFLGLNRATSVSEWDLTADLLYVANFTLAPTSTFSNLKVTGGRITGPVSLTGAGTSTATFLGTDFGGGLALAGAWGAFNGFGDTFTGGSFTNTTTGGAIVMDNATTGRNQITINAQGSAVGALYFQRAGSPKWQFSDASNDHFSINDNASGYTDWLNVASGGAATIGENSASVLTAYGAIQGVSGAYPSLSGSTCSTSATQTGGELAGTFKAAAACSSGAVKLTFAAATSNGYACDAHDMTTPADSMNQTATTTTSVTFTGSMAANDVVVWKCIGF